ncbi:FctA domain-containing protein [Enterococcus devriesei]|uniref:Spy0128 family protein n=1 Tax=Enterococcus devriesei TaxID=319970 RepID=UPI00288E5390|nr:FctA domain-containing protein [Enterococcus devriesei]MDT2821030.1 FctA domain-containing protein [Enterococcus devriesei]
MKVLKRLWSLAAIFSIIAGLVPAQMFAETTEEPATVVVTDAVIKDPEEQEVTKNNRLAPKSNVKLVLDWSLSKTTLIEDGAKAVYTLPSNLTYPEQSGDLSGVGSYEVKNKQLIFTFDQNYSLMEDGQAPDFSSAKFYEGVVTLNAQTTGEELEEESVDFGKNIVKTLYYDKKVDPVADPLKEKEKTEAAVRAQTETIQPQAHEPDLNTRGVKLFTHIKITDFANNEFSETNPAVKDANIKIHFDWALDDKEEILAGDNFTYTLPNYFSIHNPITNEPLINGDKEVLGHFSLSKEGELVVTFNKEAENLAQRAGTIDLRTQLNITTENEIVEIPTGITGEDGKDITIKIPVVKADISKSGIIEKDNSVTWTIIINEDRRELKNALVTEHFPEGLEYWKHLDMEVKNDDGNWEKAPNGFVTMWVDKIDNTYKYRFSSAGMNKPVKITVKTKITDKEKRSFKNRVTIAGDNFIASEAEETVAFEKKNNYKICNGHDITTGVFDWEVKATYTNANGTMKDWFYQRSKDPEKPEIANHYLVEDSIEVTDEKGNEIPKEKWQLSTDGNDFVKKDDKYIHFTLKFDDPGVYIIKYSSQSFEVPAPIKTDFGNTVVIQDGESNSEEITIEETASVDGTIGVGKKAIEKDFKNNTIEWQVDINTKGVEMNNAVITDRYTTLAGTNKSALQLNESTLELVAKNSLGDSVVLEKGKDFDLGHLTGDPDFKEGFKIILKQPYDKTTSTITMTYQTHFFVDEQPQNATGATLMFVNSAVVNYTDAKDEGHTDGAETSTWVHSTYKYNGVKYGKYLREGEKVDSAFHHKNPFTEQAAEENSVYWTALFNTWQTKVPKNTVIKEALGDGQELKELVIYDVELYKGAMDGTLAVETLGDKWDKDDYKYEVVDGIPTITILKEKNKPFAVFVSAKASDELHRYKNKATMSTDGDDMVIEGLVEKSEKTKWIDKSGTQGTDSDYRKINWSVVVNKDAHKIIDPVIKDTIKMNQQSFVYDNDKNVVVKVYKAKKIGSTNNFEKDGAAIEFAKGKEPKVSMDSVAGTQTLEIALGEAIDTPYIIEYQTMLDPAIQNGKKISNSAAISGKDIQFHETTKEVIVKSTDGEGTSTGINGVLMFRKLDEKGALITSSAFFDLYRRDKDGNLSLLMQDIEVQGDKIIQGNDKVDKLSNLRYGDYSIKESKAPEGYIKDEQQHDFTISKDSVEYTFSLNNKKDVPTTDIQLKAKKVLEGRDLAENEFSFVLKDKDGTVLQTKSNAADGTITFDKLDYDKKGEYTYTISEVIPAEKDKAAGMTYDETVFDVTVKVTEKEGKLTAVADYKKVEKDKVPTFTNEFTPANRPSNASIVLNAKKVLNGRDLVKDEYSFVLKDKAGTELQTKSNAADGTITFDELNYTEIGEHNYTISEVIPEGEAKETGITYDEKVYSVTVTVSEKEDKLSATSVYKDADNKEIDEVVFTNKYKALPTDISLKAKKVLEGRDLVKDEFSFVLKDKDGTILRTKSNAADGTITFDKLDYDKKGDYNYTISEVVPAEKETGITYDEKVYNVTVKIEEKAGQLSATAVYKDADNKEIDEVVFTNKYKALPTDAVLKAKKVLNGRGLTENEFSFVLKDKVGTELQTKSNAADGTITFDKLDYDKKGDYNYTISEVVPAEKETGITYDEKVYNVTVKVEEKENQLIATAVYNDADNKEVDEVVFTNNYKALPTDAVLKAKKVLEGRDLTEDEFSFVLKDKAGTVLQTKKNALDGTITFDKLDYDKKGDYTYTISEVIPAEKDKATGMTYDETVFDVTVKVEEKENQLIATAVYNDADNKEVDEVVFTNNYKALPTEISLKAKKVLDGRKLTENEFSFILKGKDGTVQTKKNAADGAITFDKLDYDKKGDYTYTISEVIPEDEAKETGITYDETVYNVTVTVAEKDGKLSATAVYKDADNKEVDEAIFKNIFKETPNKPKDPKYGEILLKKVDGDSGKALAKAEFKLIDADKKVIAEKIITGTDGTVLINGLNDGEYQLIETQAPAGYKLDATPIKFVVKNSQADKKEVEKENNRTTLPGTGGDEADNGSSNNSSKRRSTYTVNNDTSSASSRSLPKTGSSSNIGLIILGLFFLSVVSLVYIGKRKKV